MNDSKAEKLNEKFVLFLRYKLQKGLLSRDGPPTAAVMLEMSGFIKRLEDAPDLEAPVLLHSNIYKIVEQICRFDILAADEEFKIHGRCQRLHAKWVKTLGDYSSVNAEVRKLTLIPEPRPQLAEPERIIQEAPPESIEEADPTPTICITQLTPEQCANLEALAETCDPPLDRAVLELMCMLPQFSTQNEHETYNIVPFGHLINSVRDLEEKTNLERKFDGWGPKIPPHILQLTQWDEGRFGRWVAVDSKTGNGIVFKEYGLSDPEERDPKWENLLGDRKPIEELLQEWIDKFLEGSFMPSGVSYSVHEEGPRRIVDILMDTLKYKALLHQYGWPESIPLPAPQHREFLKSKNELGKTTFYNRPKGLVYKWGSIVSKWRFRNNSFIKYDTINMEQYELLSALDRRIRDVLDYHERRVEDQKYALAADIPLQRELLGACSLSSFSSSGDGRRVEVTPDMIMKRFDEVFAASPEVVDEDMEKMRAILTRAYERWKSFQQGIYEQDWVEGEDDDSTSDYEPEDEEMEEDGDEYEDDVDMEDLDVEVLKADMADDVEMIRSGLAGCQIGME